LALAESLEGLYLIVAALPKDNLEIIYDNSKKTPKPKREGINSQFTKWGLLRSFLSALSQKGASTKFRGPPARPTTYFYNKGLVVGQLLDIQKVKATFLLKLAQLHSRKK